MTIGLEEIILLTFPSKELEELGYKSEPLLSERGLRGEFARITLLTELAGNCMVLELLDNILFSTFLFGRHFFNAENLDLESYKVYVLMTQRFGGLFARRVIVDSSSLELQEIGKRNKLDRVNTSPCQNKLFNTSTALKVLLRLEDVSSELLLAVMDDFIENRL